MPSYEELLKSAMEKLPKERGTGERFEMPVVQVETSGTQTIVKNYSEITQKLRRDGKHMLKFLSKELASQATTDGTRATFNAKLGQKQIQTKLESYVKEFVICKICGRPDTRITKENRIDQMRCDACGARSAVKEL